MGMLGEMFPGQKLRDESGEDGEGEQYRPPRFDIDLDSGVVRMPTLGAPADTKESSPEE
ncbi:hypothetical protein [Pseudonocardia acaciae]|uniref:hypothetical protein n=1 Tax=Pseudonocardia acaciae TaxID=551276 RepID=UPI000AEE0878|nr:hypothetical protein [Pseudonocardia acaciae]